MEDTYESDEGETIRIEDYDRWLRRASQALDVLTPDGELAEEDKLNDLLTHLRHYAYANDLDFERAITSSEMHFEAEKRPKE